MNILITGDPSPLAIPLIKEFVKWKNRVVLASIDAGKLDLDRNDATVHSISPADDSFQGILSSYGFDVVVFIPIREEQLETRDDSNPGCQLDGLRNTLELCKQGDVKHFFYLSSTEVYGNSEDSTEDSEPVPASINGHTLTTGEQYCKFYQREFGVRVSIVRLPYVFGPDVKTGFLFRAIRDCKDPGELSLPGSRDRAFAFLHSHDVADFLKRAMDEEYSTAALVINLSPSASITNWEFSGLLKEHFPDAVIHFDDLGSAFTRPATVSTAKRVFDWVDLYELSAGIDSYANSIEETSAPKRAKLGGLLRKYFGRPEGLKWIELILGAGLTQYLSQLTGTLIQYKYVDFRLLFVVIMASVYGLRLGLLASLLVSLSLFYTWYQLEIDWSLLIFNVGNWFPPVLYFITGLILGYHHDRTETILHNNQAHIKLLHEKYDFLYGVFQEIRKLKDEFREQVIGYRDSFGKIYTITQGLDTLQEHCVYFRALTILEDLMENNSIAIYSLGPNRSYARLEVNSSSLNDTLAKSLKVSDIPEAMSAIEQGAIFQNTSLLPNYPAFIAPVASNSYPFNVPVAIIVIWSATFEQQSTYYYNLFKVISGLIQSSLARATRFLEANYDQTYIPATRIMTPDAFLEVLKTHAEMKSQKIADYQLIKLERSPIDFQQLDSNVKEAVRTADIVGIRRDGACYILLSQADKAAANDAITRLEKLGLYGKIVDGHEIPLD